MTQSPTAGRHAASYPAHRTCYPNHVVRVQVEEGRCGRNSTVMCTLVIQSWSFSNLTLLQSVIVRQSAKHSWRNAEHTQVRTDPRTVVVSMVRDAVLDDQLIVLGHCL